MSGLLIICCGFLGGCVGWALGRWAGIPVAMILGVIGSAGGVYLARLIGRTLF
jgi:hypothetical protein